MSTTNNGQNSSSGTNISNYDAALVCVARIENSIKNCSQRHKELDTLYKEIRDADWTGAASDKFFSEYNEYNESTYSQVISKISEIKSAIKSYAKIDEDIDAYANRIMQDSRLSQANINNFVETNFGYTLATGFIDYSVSNEDLRAYQTLTLSSGKQIPIYSCDKNSALYIISSGLNSNEKAELSSRLKGVLKDNQMAIVTYDNNLYHYDVTNRDNCTSNYALVANYNGKMFSFNTRSGVEIVCDNGSKNDTLITSYNGMILANRMNIRMETGAVVPITVDVKQNIEGGQRVTEFTRLSFSAGTYRSTGSEYASVRMGEGWQQYANTSQNKANGTWINENMTNKVVKVGSGPTGSYAQKYQTVGQVDSSSIPVIITAGDRAGSQTMQGTVCYHHEGARPGVSSKDMLYFTHTVVTNW